MIVGIEIAADAARAVRLRRVRRGHIPEALLEVPLGDLPDDPGADRGALADAAQQLGEEVGLRNPVVGLAVPDAWCLYRVASFPYHASARIASTFMYSLEDRLPEPLGRYVLAPVTRIARAGQKGGRVLAAACLTDRLRCTVEAFREAGLDPWVVQPAGVALGAFVRHCSKLRSDDGVLLIRVTTTECQTTHVVRGETIACQSLRLDPHGRGGDLADRVAFAVRAGHLDDDTRPCARAVLMAPQEAFDALAGPLGEALALPVTRLPENAPGGLACAALGVAADAAARGYNAPSLRVGGLAFARYARRMERLVAGVLLLCAGLVVLLAVRTRVVEAADLRTLRQVRTEQQQTYERVVGARRGAPTLAAMEAAVAQARTEAERPSHQQMVSCLKVWVDLMRLIPRALNARFELIDVDQRRVSLEGRVPNSARVWKVRQALEASNRFSPDAPVVTRTPDGRYATFSMELKYRR